MRSITELLDKYGFLAFRIPEDFRALFVEDCNANGIKYYGDEQLTTDTCDLRMIIYPINKAIFDKPLHAWIGAGKKTILEMFLPEGIYAHCEGGYYGARIDYAAYASREDEYILSQNEELISEPWIGALQACTGNLKDRTTTLTELPESSDDDDSDLAVYEDWLKWKKKCSQEYEEIILDNLALLLKYKDAILNEPRFSSIKFPRHLYEPAYVQLGDANITIGKLLTIITREEAFSYTCPYCNGKAYLVEFHGSVLSGIIYGATYKCVSNNCKKTSQYHYHDYKHTGIIPRGYMSCMRKIISKYENTKYSNPACIQELLAYLHELVEVGITNGAR